MWPAWGVAPALAAFARSCGARPSISTPGASLDGRRPPSSLLPTVSRPDGRCRAIWWVPLTGKAPSVPPAPPESLTASWVASPAGRFRGCIVERRRPAFRPPFPCVSHQSGVESVYLSFSCRGNCSRLSSERSYCLFPVNALLVTLWCLRSSLLISRLWHVGSFRMSRTPNLRPSFCKDGGVRQPAREPGLHHCNWFNRGAFWFPDLVKPLTQPLYMSKQLPIWIPVDVMASCKNAALIVGSVLLSMRLHLTLQWPLEIGQLAHFYGFNTLAQLVDFCSHQNLPLIRFAMFSCLESNQGFCDLLLWPGFVVHAWDSPSLFLNHSGHISRTENWVVAAGWIHHHPCLLLWADLGGGRWGRMLLFLLGTWGCEKWGDIVLQPAVWCLASLS